MVVPVCSQLKAQWLEHLCPYIYYYSKLSLTYSTLIIQPQTIIKHYSSSAAVSHFIVYCHQTPSRTIIRPPGSSTTMLNNAFFTITTMVVSALLVATASATSEPDHMAISRRDNIDGDTIAGIAGIVLSACSLVGLIALLVYYHGARKWKQAVPSQV